MNILEIMEKHPRRQTDWNVRHVNRLDRNGLRLNKQTGDTFLISHELHLTTHDLHERVYCCYKEGNRKQEMRKWITRFQKTLPAHLHV